MKELEDRLHQQSLANDSALSNAGANEGAKAKVSHEVNQYESQPCLSGYTTLVPLLYHSSSRKVSEKTPNIQQI
jgi:hypothetical protein